MKLLLGDGLEAMGAVKTKKKTAAAKGGLGFSAAFMHAGVQVTQKLGSAKIAGSKVGAQAKTAQKTGSSADVQLTTRARNALELLNLETDKVSLPKVLLKKGETAKHLPGLAQRLAGKGAEMSGKAAEQGAHILGGLEKKGLPVQQGAAPGGKGKVAVKAEKASLLQGLVGKKAAVDGKASETKGLETAPSPGKKAASAIKGEAQNPIPDATDRKEAGPAKPAPGPEVESKQVSAARRAEPNATVETGKTERQIPQDTKGKAVPRANHQTAPANPERTLEIPKADVRSIEVTRGLEKLKTTADSKQPPVPDKDHTPLPGKEHTKLAGEQRPSAERATPAAARPDQAIKTAEQMAQREAKPTTAAPRAEIPVTEKSKKATQAATTTPTSEKTTKQAQKPIEAGADTGARGKEPEPRRTTVPERRANVVGPREQEGQTSSFEILTSKRSTTGQSTEQIGTELEATDPSTIKAEITKARGGGKGGSKPHDMPRVFKQIEAGLRQAYVVRPRSVSIKLVPETLGEMNVRVRIENDLVKAEIETESRKVAAVIRDNQATLEQKMREQGIELDRFEVRDREERNEERGEREQTDRGDAHARHQQHREQAEAHRNRQSGIGETEIDRGSTGEPRDHVSRPEQAPDITAGRPFSFTV